MGNQKDGKMQLTEDQRNSIDTDGYAVIPDVLSRSECERWSDVLDNAWEQDRQTLPPHPAGEEQGVQFVRNPLRHSLEFERCIIDPLILDAAHSMLGPSIILHIMNSRRVNPGYGLQPLHDLTRTRGRPFRVCNTIWCLDSFTPDNGATRVIPGTHMSDREALDRMSDPLAPHPDERYVRAPRGSVVIFNSKLIHSGTVNRTSRPRRSIQCNFAVSSMEPFYPWRDQLSMEALSQLADLSRDLLGLTG